MAAFVFASYIYYIKFHDFGLLCAAAVSVKSLSAAAAAAFAVVATEEV